MKYMLDKIEVHESKEKIICMSDKIVEMLLECDYLNDSEKLMAIELALASINYNLYKISGDGDK